MPTDQHHPMDHQRPTDPDPAQPCQEPLGVSDPASGTNGAGSAVLTPASDAAGASGADVCPTSTRVDGPHHSWVFDGDDPRVVCVFCGKVRDALTGAVLQPGEGAQDAH